jgi:hypothetical protein
MLFIIPIGAGIPGGVLLARAHGLPWQVTSALYLISDMLLALAFEPLLRLAMAYGRKVPFLARLAWAFRIVTQRLLEQYRGAGPFALIMIAFGVDPMTGRAVAAAAGHGFLSGWAIAIAGDMLYFWVVMVSTLKLNAYLGDPYRTMWLILAVMFLLPLAMRYLKTAYYQEKGRGGSAGRLKRAGGGEI